MIVILLAGQARVGKTTLANYIAEFCVDNNLTPRFIPFAVSIKKKAASLGYTKDSNQEEYRKFCQHLGQSMRDIDPDYWVKEWERLVCSVQDEETQLLNEQPDLYKERVVLVDDCRYPNELSIGKKYKALDMFISAGSRKLVEHDADWRKHKSEELAYNIDRYKDKISNPFSSCIYNERTEKEFREFCFQHIPEWLGLIPNNNKAKCNCEYCRSCRENRKSRTKTHVEILEDTLNDLIDKLQENWRDVRNEDSDYDEDAD